MLRHCSATSLVKDALTMARFRRRPGATLIFYSDRESQYCRHQFQNTFKGCDMRSSMSRKGNCWDTQSNITMSAAFGLTRAGIGVMPLR
jgi:transposase InsO family protein